MSLQVSDIYKKEKAGALGASAQIQFLPRPKATNHHKSPEPVLDALIIATGPCFATKGELPACADP